MNKSQCFSCVYKVSNLRCETEKLTNELSTTQDNNAKQDDELKRLQDEKMTLKVEEAALQEKCRLILEEVSLFVNVRIHYFIAEN